MIDIKVEKDGVGVACNIKISGKAEDVLVEMCTLLDALESKKASRDLLHQAIDYRIRTLTEKYRRLEDDGEL